ncbi:diaminopimelate epimerase [Zhihengliuella salsuginis]|uniref:Diaminopimelate epimerase n=1 Tax=Zhihengliuella salsuginis TaxID=578222 RepID=A0ABQ3GI94_9MICC|nr:diaminopimelate epimerase [Zhihengliuella salsuginis]GHD07286.1 diaminopimelate epimerase [Zhihengliuella salsuginis]
MSHHAAEALAPLAAVPFAKGHGTGNDFVLIADPEAAHVISAEQVAMLCDRHQGIGGDGLIRAVRTRDVAGAEDLHRAHPEAEWFMDYRNGDGSIAEMCGNGVRVFVHFLIDQDLIALAPGESVAIGTRAGLKRVALSENGYAVDIGSWRFTFAGQAEEKALDSLVETPGIDAARPALSVDMGNPHTVVALQQREELEAAELYTVPRVDPVPAEGTNVEYVVPSEPLVEDGIGRIAMRVHERGVGETQSCGTGACAAVIATRHWAGNVAADAWDVEVPGGVVRVRFSTGDDGAEHVELSGPAQLVAHGRIG